MKNLWTRLLPGLLALALGAGVTTAQPLPHDTRILSGTLTNGVKWLYRQHDNPPGKMALMIHVRSGSLNETDAQRGLAHFLEHMAFNGTEHFPPGKLIPYFESIGMQFGGDLNAFTSFDQTVYMLYTPNTQPEEVDKALMVLSDYAFRMSLLPEELDKERGVILEETRRGKNASQRLRDKVWPDLFAGSRFANRLPIGDEKIVAQAARPEFVDYYRAYYRPENITVVLAGDAPLPPFLPSIQKWFGEYQPANSVRRPLGAEFKPFSAERAIVASDPEMAYCQVQMVNLLPGRPPVTTVAQWRQECLESLAGWIIGRRYDDRVKKGEASFRGAGAGVNNFFNEALLVTGSAMGEARDWAKMLTELIVEIKRAREYGFTAHELAMAKRETLAGAEHAVRTEPTVNARSLISSIVSSLNSRETFLAAQQSLSLYQEQLPGISLKEVNRTFKDQFKPGTFAFVLTLSSKAEVPSQEEVLKTARAAQAQKVEAPREEKTPASLLAKSPKPGKVTDVTTEPDLQITSAWLPNGARVHYRFMDYKKDSILLSVSLAGGEIEETAANKGITEVALLAVNNAATHRLPSSAFRDLMTGKNINVSASKGSDAFIVNVTGSPKDLETGLQAAHAVLTDGLIEEAAFKNWKLGTLQSIEQREKMPQFKASEAFSELLSGGDIRQIPIQKKHVEALSPAAAQAWFDRLRREAPLEIAIVGDLPWIQVRPLIEKYLGSLPARNRAAAQLDRLRDLPRAQGPLEKRVEVRTITPQAVAYAGFVGCDGTNAADARALTLAANIMTSRLVKKIREEMSAVYSISANSVPAWVYRDAGRFVSSAPCSPDNANKVAETVHQMFQDFADQGPTDEELANAKKQIAHHLENTLREPNHWWGILRDLDYHHRNLQEEQNIQATCAATTREQVQNSFKKYYTPARKTTVIALPVKSADTGPASKP